MVYRGSISIPGGNRVAKARCAVIGIKVANAPHRTNALSPRTPPALRCFLCHSVTIFSLVFALVFQCKLRNKLQLKTGDKVFFEENKGKIYITNASQITLSTVQAQMQGEAEKAGFQTEDDVVAYIKEL